MKQYERYKDSGVEWLGEVPEHWKVKRLRYICDNIQTGTTPSTTKFAFFDGDINWFNPADLNVEILETSIKKISHQAISAKEIKLFNSDSILVVGIGATTGKTSYMSNSGTFNQQITGFHSIIENNKYLFYSFKCFSSLFLKIANYTTLPILNNEFFKTFSIVIPHIEEQGRIVAFLDEKCGQIDRAVEQKERMIELLQERRAATIQRAVTQGLGPNVPLKDSNIDWIGKIPTHWQIKKLKYVLEEKNNKQISIECQLNYIGMENVESWTGQYIETDSEVEGLANVFNENNVLFGKLRPYLAKVYLAREKGLCSTEFIVYEILDNNSTYIQRLLSSTNFINIVNASTYGSKMPRANSNFIGNLKIAIPPLSEQSEIAAYLDKVSTKTEQAIKLKRQEIERLKEYRQTLINSAVTGKIKI